jgi:hypothetical protein
MNYYLFLGNPGTEWGQIVTHLMITLLEFDDLTAGEQTFLKIPQPDPIIGWRYLGPSNPGVIVLGDDFLSFFEAPPNPECHWDGEQWVCPDTSVAE